MIDYGNMPVLKWSGPISAKKAIAQIHHEEPVIIQMPEDFNMDIEASACHCKINEKNGNYYDCNAKSVLTALSEKNQLPELTELAKVAHDAGQIIDIIPAEQRLVIHD